MNASSIPEVPHFYQQLAGDPQSAPTFDLLNFFKSQYFANIENYTRNQTATASAINGSSDSTAAPYLNGTRTQEENKFKEQSMRLEILQIELETAKLNRDIAEINKQIAIKKLSKENL